MNYLGLLTGTWITMWALTALADENPANVPKPFPATRPEMKAALETLKDRQPRIPLPESQDGQAGYLPESWGGGGGLGGFRQFNNFGTGGRGERNPEYQLNYLLTDECFWVVSRGNNCHYCLGHQELKLRANGLDDNAIAVLDTDWRRFDPRKQLALAFARKLTLEPDHIGDADIQKLKELFSDAEIIELAFTVALFNSVNRWTDSLGLRQERHLSDAGEITFVTPTNSEFQSAKSIVIPSARSARHQVDSLVDVQQAIAASRTRAPRVALPPENTARQELKGVIGDRKPFAWERALTQLPLIGTSYVTTWNTILADDHLKPRFKAELAVITAVNNQAWYAAAHAVHRLNQLGASPEDLSSLFDDTLTPDGGAAYRLAAKSTTDPHLITDADIAQIRQRFSDPETAQIIQVICLANMFDRFTESLGLSPEDDVAR